MFERIFGSKSGEAEKPVQSAPKPVQLKETIVKRFLDLYERGRGSPEDVIQSLCGICYYNLQELQQLKTDYSQLVLLHNTMRQSNEAIVKENQSLRQSIEQLSRIVSEQRQSINTKQLVSRETLLKELTIVNGNFADIIQRIESMEAQLDELANRELPALKIEATGEVERTPAQSNTTIEGAKSNGAKAAQSVNKIEETVGNKLETNVGKKVPFQESIDDGKKSVGRPPKVNSEIIEKIKALNKEGKSIRAIAKGCGISHTTVSNILKAIVESEKQAMEQQEEAKNEVVKKLHEQEGF